MSKITTQIDKDNEVWLNKSKSGNGVYIRLTDEIFLVGNWKTLQKFAGGDIEGFPLNVMLSEDE